ncbi:hypothetical protein OSB04_005813 [Centaurea solstitialis]|uniref:Uncharacterized protein n=1 Tax=Centaurea solstitialis TaxID=347529 RepID=A0AA38TGR7_9ASTR|nr:hypothetical protein OSB04_005813 [Centaurea solstitialis]
MIDLKIEATLAARNQGAKSLQQRRDRGRSYVDIEVSSNALLKGKKKLVIVYMYSRLIQEVPGAQPYCVGSSSQTKVSRGASKQEEKVESEAGTNKEAKSFQASREVFRIVTNVVGIIPEEYGQGRHQAKLNGDRQRIQNTVVGLTLSVHFVVIRVNFASEQLADVIAREAVSRHGGASDSYFRSGYPHHVMSLREISRNLLTLVCSSLPCWYWRASMRKLCGNKRRTHMRSSEQTKSYADRQRSGSEVPSEKACPFEGFTMEGNQEKKEREIFGFSSSTAQLWENGSFSFVNRRIVVKFGQQLHNSLFFNLTGGIEHRRLQ